jgi:hypothetical protein
MTSCLTLIVLSCTLAAETATPTLRGTVEDGQGHPVIGARIDIATAAPRVGRGLFCPSCYADCKKKTRTDEQGRFEIGGLDPTLKFHLLASMPGKKARLTELVDPLAEDVTIVLADLPRDIPPERMVRGQVVDATGLAIEGALVEPGEGKTADRRWWGRVDGVDPTVTDADGHFAMVLPKDFEGVDVQVTADGLAGTSLALLAPGSHEHRIVVPPGTRVTGRLVRAGSPLPNVRVSVVQLERTAGHHFIKAVGDVTDSDGKFIFDYLPAKERYAIFSVVGEGPQEFVLTTKLFTAAADGQQRDLGALEAIPALRLAGRVEVADGETLPRDCKIMLVREPAWDLIAVPLGEDGRFEIGGLPPEAFEVRVATRQFHIDASRIGYQMLDDLSFGLRLKRSLDDLRIPLQPDK